jgi:hypothetical protein
MSQNDFVIANDTAANVRADLNLALQALASTSSGATAPATTYANMLWYDTAANFLYMRSEADDAWIKLGTLDQGTNTFSAEVTLPTLATATWETGTATDEAVISPAKLAAGVAALVSGGGVVVISETVVSTGVASIDLTGFDASLYTSYEIELMNLEAASDPVFLNLRTSTDGGSTYDSGGSDYGYIFRGVDGQGTDLSGQALSNSFAILASTVDGGNSGVSGVIRLSGPGLAKRTRGVYNFAYTRSFSIIAQVYGGFERNSNADVDGVRIYFSSGNVSGGTVVFRGIK